MFKFLIAILTLCPMLAYAQDITWSQSSDNQDIINMQSWVTKTYLVKELNLHTRSLSVRNTEFSGSLVSGQMLLPTDKTDSSGKQKARQVCFLSMMRNGIKTPLQVVFSIGSSKWETEECLGLEASGLIQYHGFSRVAMLYRGRGDTKVEFTIPVVYRLNLKTNTLTLDQEATNLMGSYDIQNMLDMKHYLRDENL